MNKTLNEVQSFVASWKELNTQKPVRESLEVIIAPPFPLLVSLKEIPVKLAAQNCHQDPSGAFTGEVSAAMLSSVGCEYVILGHSERRKYFGETDELVSEKISSALANSLSAIVCVGETLEERQTGKHFDVVKRQLVVALSAQKNLNNIIIAYEPVWAIGTGETATPLRAEEMHAFIRKELNATFGEVANTTSIIYGGSCNVANAQELFACPNIDGGLIGGASLKPEDFYKMAFSF